MKSMALNIVIMATTFLIGTSLTSAIRVYERSGGVRITCVRSIQLKGCRGIGFGLSSTEVSRSKMEMECDGMHFTIYQAPFNSIEEASNEFEKILDHSSIVINEPISALSHLQLGRARAMSGDRAKAQAAYQDFLTFWKDADPDIPILKQGKTEYGKLQ